MSLVRQHHGWRSRIIVMMLMLNQVFFPSFRASHHHCIDAHEQYCGFSRDLLQPWKNHNNGRESQAQEGRSSVQNHFHVR